MVLKASLCALLALCISNVVAFNLTDGNWIWTDTNRNVPTYEKRSFRREFPSPGGKTAVAAEILISADNNYTLWVNGEFIGETHTVAITSEKYCVPLEPTCNVFAVSAENLPYPSDPTRSIPNPAAFVSAITIIFSDGSKEEIVTDAKWRANVDTPGFQSVTYDDSAWPFAVILAPGNGWYYTPTPPTTISSSSSLTLSKSSWIWTDEVTPGNPPGNAPAGARAFRKTIDLPAGYIASSGAIIIGVDDGYTLYVNGVKIGSAATWNTAQRWNFTITPATDDIVIAVEAYNNIRVAGIVAAVAIYAVDCDCANALIYPSDSTWKFSPAHDVPTGFEQPGYNDGGWKYVVEEGPYGIAPWGNETVVNGN